MNIVTLYQILCVIAVISGTIILLWAKREQRKN